LFAYATSLAQDLAWSPLWDAARKELAKAGSATVAAIATQRWFNQILVDHDFQMAGQIVLLEWIRGHAELPALPADVHIRAMTPQDLPRVAEVDALAFQPLWRNSLPALQKAYQQSSYGSVAEHGSSVIGYQLSSGGSFGAHLARLAVLPEEQRRGIGGALVSELLVHMQSRGGSRVTVNTQDGNAASLALYARLGFHETGERYPVYTFQV
jgi:ribosomal-protein-alanine N-acetyltransferase